MFMSADIIVKAVMIGLMFASVLTWTIWLAKTRGAVDARDAASRARSACSRRRARLPKPHEPASAASPQVARLIRRRRDANCAARPTGATSTASRSASRARFERIEAGVGRQMMRATGILATIGATAPFVGLFGTVWGIMNSFIGISKLHTTNLAVVAPGIAEALLATAFGLAAAIPGGRDLQHVLALDRAVIARSMPMPASRSSTSSAATSVSRRRRSTSVAMPPPVRGGGVEP